VSKKLYTLSDLIEVTNSTRQKIHYWAQFSKEHYVEPAYVAGRANAKGACLIKLWTLEQLDEVVRQVRLFERAKEERKQDRIKTADPVRAKRTAQQREYRRKAREEGKPPAKQTKKRNQAVPIPIERPTLTYRPPSDEALSYEEEFQQEREERALQFLLTQDL
jgi:hypothetical protein